MQHTQNEKSKSRTDVSSSSASFRLSRRLYLLFHSFMGTDKTGDDWLEKAKLLWSPIAVFGAFPSSKPH